MPYLLEHLFTLRKIRQGTRRKFHVFCTGDATLATHSLTNEGCLATGWQSSVRGAPRRSSAPQTPTRCRSSQTQTAEGGWPRANRTVAM